MDRQKNKIQELDFEKLIELIRSDKVTWEIINANYRFDRRQTWQLREIFAGIKTLHETEQGPKQESIAILREQIYLYGSRIKSRDLLARQMFLWLLEILEQS